MVAYSNDIVPNSSVVLTTDKSFDALESENRICFFEIGEKKTLKIEKSTFWTDVGEFRKET